MVFPAPPMFFVEKYGKTFGELLPDEKNEISHRAVATELFAKKLCMVLDSLELKNQ